MLVSVALLVLLGLLLGNVMNQLQLPALLGYLVTGVILGPHFLNGLSDSLLAVSADIRELALIIILTRAGLSLDIADLKKIGRPALMMCAVPALFEIAATVCLAPLLLNFSISEALLLGSIIAAVSPAVVVPRMLQLIHSGYGTEKRIPQLILAGASVDDVFVLILFTAFLGLNQGQTFSAATLLQVPIAIGSGLLAGGILGYGLTKWFSAMSIRDSIKVLILLSCSFLLMGAEDALAGFLPFSGMLSVMSMSLVLFKMIPPTAQRLSVKFNKLWIAAELFLFVLVGASVDLSFAFASGFAPVLLIVLVSLFRMAGVWCSVSSSGFSSKEKLFCMISYLPKATVQAAIGGLPLAMGIHNGETMLTTAVLSILITAPLGAVGVDRLYRKLLTKAS